MISVVSNAPTHFAIVTPGSVTTRKSFGVAVTAQDAINNVSAGYSGTVQFTSTDNQAHLPANSPLTSGVGNFSAAFENAGALNASLPRTRSSQPSQGLRVRLPSALLQRSLSPQAPRRAGLSACYTVRAKANSSSVLVFEVHAFRAAAGERDARGLRTATCTLDSPVFHSDSPRWFSTRSDWRSTALRWSATGLPPGLGVGSQTGEIFGTPTSPGGYNFPVTVTDSGTPPVMTPMSYTVTINDPAPPVINVTPAPPSGAVNLPYSFTFTAASTATPLMWRVSAGTPPGPMLNPDGVFSGTPTATGTSSLSRSSRKILQARLNAARFHHSDFCAWLRAHRRHGRTAHRAYGDVAQQRRGTRGGGNGWEWRTRRDGRAL